jgi:ferrous iron transport protein B
LTEVSQCRILMIGNPNAGKTSLFNALTLSSYKVANYPGVTVEKREGCLKLVESEAITIVDAPGIYSIHGDSLDEQITIQELERGANLILLVIDASNLERNLYLASEILDRGVPVLIALNMIDLAAERGMQIREARLAQLLDVQVVPIVAARGQGVQALSQSLVAALRGPRVSSARFAWRAKAGAIESTDDVSSQRYRWIAKIIEQVVARQQTSGTIRVTLDHLTMHPVWGLVIFLCLMALMFQCMYTWASVPMDYIDWGITQLSSALRKFLPAGDLQSLLLDGVVAGVGSILVFIPQIALLFFFLGLLEDSGYLSRAAFVMDRVMRVFGLQGRSFIPLLSSFACAIPGIMATRSIPSFSDRMITILVAPFMSCSARLPIYTVLISACIPSITLLGTFSLQGIVMLLLYLLGILGAAGTAFLCRKTLFLGQPSLFVMEIPLLRRPSLRLVLREVRDRIWLFVKNAGSIILACSVILWFLASHPRGALDEPPVVGDSYAGFIGQLLQPLFAPLGFSWEICVAIFSSFAAREVFVSSLATMYSLGAADESSTNLISLLQRLQGEGVLLLPSVIALLVFYVFSCQCMSTLAVCRRETGSWRWPVALFVYMTVLAYGAAFAAHVMTSALLR